MRFSLVIGWTVLGVALLADADARAQPAGPDPAQIEAMKKLAFLVGTWEGESVMRLGPRETKATGTETVQSKQGGLTLLVEGKFSTKIPGADREVVIHDALGVIGYDPAKKQYFMHAYRAGKQTSAELKVIGKGFEWGFQDPERGTHIRFRMELSDEGEWVETGSYSPDQEEWTEFMQMRLKKVKD